MAKVILMCGRICSGKSTYAQKMQEKIHAVILSVDEIMLRLFGQQAGDQHDEYVARIKQYLYEKSLEIVRAGVNVILDEGFWTKEERNFAKAFYRSHNIECELHYIDVSDELWRQRLKLRNRAVLAGKTSAYYVDDTLARKFTSIFEVPDAEEVDVRA